MKPVVVKPVVVKVVDPTIPVVVVVPVVVVKGDEVIPVVVAVVVPVVVTVKGLDEEEELPGPAAGGITKL